MWHGTADGAIGSCRRGSLQYLAGTEREEVQREV
jgi:hypothetical protein